MEDREIIELYLARKENAIAETARKYGRMLRSIAYRILNNNADSEECENDSYLAAWGKIPPLVPTNLTAFLGRIVRNIALDKYDYYTADKRNRAFEVALDELGDILRDNASPDREYGINETAQFISDFLHTKSYDKRVVFVRRYWYCYEISQIAAEFGFTESKVKSMLMRLRKELKVYLERNGVII